MANMLSVSNIRFCSASLENRSRGLRGFISFDVGNVLHLDGIAVRRTLGGRHFLAFPERRDDEGRAYPLIRPLGHEARRAIESQVLGELRQRGYLP